MYNLIKLCIPSVKIKYKVASLLKNIFNFRKLQQQYDEFEKLREEEKIAALEKLKEYNDARC